MCTQRAGLPIRYYGQTCPLRTPGVLTDCMLNNILLIRWENGPHTSVKICSLNSSPSELLPASSRSPHFGGIDSQCFHLRRIRQYIDFALSYNVIYLSKASMCDYICDRYSCIEMNSCHTTLTSLRCEDIHALVDEMFINRTRWRHHTGHVLEEVDAVSIICSMKKTRDRGCSYRYLQIRYLNNCISGMGCVPLWKHERKHYCRHMKMYYGFILYISNWYIEYISIVHPQSWNLDIIHVPGL